MTTTLSASNLAPDAVVATTVRSGVVDPGHGVPEPDLETVRQRLDDLTVSAREQDVAAAVRAAPVDTFEREIGQVGAVLVLHGRVEQMLQVPALGGAEGVRFQVLVQDGSKAGAGPCLGKRPEPVQVGGVGPRRGPVVEVQDCVVPVGRARLDAALAGEVGDRVAADAVYPRGTEVDGNRAGEVLRPDAPSDPVAGLEDDNVAETAGAKLGSRGQAGDAGADHEDALVGARGWGGGCAGVGDRSGASPQPGSAEMAGPSPAAASPALMKVRRLGGGVVVGLGVAGCVLILRERYAVLRKRPSIDTSSRYRT